jgi:hypothetical protein
MPLQAVSEHSEVDRQANPAVRLEFDHLVGAAICLATLAWRRGSGQQSDQGMRSSLDDPKHAYLSHLRITARRPSHAATWRSSSSR